MRRASRFQPVSLRARLQVLATVLFVLVLIAVGLAALMVRSWDRALDRRSDAQAAAAQVAQLRLAYSDQETGVRGYALTGNPAFLEPFASGTERASRRVAELRERASLIAGLAGALADVESAAGRWQALAVPDPAGTVTRDDDTRDRFEAVRRELDELEQLVDAEVAGLVADADQARRNTLGVLFGSAAIALGGSLLVSMLFRRWITTPLAEISDAAAQLAVDDQAPVPRYLAPELDRLSTTIAALQRSIAGARDRAITAYTGLEQSAVLALQVRAELAHELGDLPGGWSVDSLLVPAEGVVAGDCYDVGLLDPTSVYAIVIDVTGHGAKAALDALKSKSQLRASLRNRLAPGAAIGALAREAQRDDGGDMLTAIVMVIDTENGECRYANAGHPPVVLTNGEQIERQGPTGPLIGAFAAAWSTATFVVPPGWTVFVHTDGITDGVGPERERFGDDRLDECLRGDHDPPTLIERVRSCVEEFRLGPRTDDVTALALRRPGARVSSPQSPDEQRDTVRA